MASPAQPQFTPQINWLSSAGVVAYETALATMATRAAAIHNGAAAEHVWLLEHPALYTAGRSANEAELLNPTALPVHHTGRGGKFTYHGPGQLIAYVQLNLANRGRDVRQFVWQLEEWVIQTLQQFAVAAERRPGRIGLWVAHDSTESKIAAIGVRVEKWVTLHGLAINLNPNLDNFNGIIPCGISDYGVTSLAALGKNITRVELEATLLSTFPRVFGECQILHEAV